MSDDSSLRTSPLNWVSSSSWSPLPGASSCSFVLFLDLFSPVTVIFELSTTGLAVSPPLLTSVSSNVEFMSGDRGPSNSDWFALILLDSPRKLLSPIFSANVSLAIKASSLSVKFDFLGSAPFKRFLWKGSLFFSTSFLSALLSLCMNSLAKSSRL